MVLGGFLEQNGLQDEEDARRIAAFDTGMRDVAADEGAPVVYIPPAFETATSRRRAFHHRTADCIPNPNACGQRTGFSPIPRHLLQADSTPDDVPAYEIGPWFYPSHSGVQP